MNILKAILSFFLKHHEEPTVAYPGVLLDTRSEEEKAKDVQFGEIVAKADPVIWEEIPEKDWPIYGSQNQNWQSSCVANSGRKALRVMLKKNSKIDLDFSSLDIYRRRANYPAGGMMAYDLWNILAQGATLNPIVPSDGFSEAYANTIKVPAWAREVGNTFKISSGVNLPINIEDVASVIQRTGKAVVLFFFFTQEEWSRKVPVILDRSLRLTEDRALKHAVAAVVRTLYDGKKSLVIDDSALFGGLDRRVITEDFFRARCFYAGYPMNFTFEPGGEKPIHRFDRDIPFGEVSDEVKILQQCLRYEGLFPANIADKDLGRYGATTAGSVLAFQQKYQVADPRTLEQLGGRNVGPSTRVALNKRFA